MTDARPSQARREHQQADVDAAAAAQHRARRNTLVRALRDEDPERWTYTALAAAVGCTKELIAAICQGRV